MYVVILAGFASGITVMYQDRNTEDGQPSTFRSFVHSSLSLLQYTMGQVEFEGVFEIPWSRAAASILLVGFGIMGVSLK